MESLFRSSRERVFGGVCAGVAEYFGLDTKAVRLAWLVAALFGAGVLLYMILLFILPEN